MVEKLKQEDLLIKVSLEGGQIVKRTSPKETGFLKNMFDWRLYLRYLAVMLCSIPLAFIEYYSGSTPLALLVALPLILTVHLTLRHYLPTLREQENTYK